VRRMLPVLLFAGMGTAGAQSPEDFAYRAGLTAAPGLNVVTLSEPVYRAAQTQDLRDLRFFNARGDSLPFAPAGMPPLAPGRAFELKMVPLPVQPQARDKLLADFALRVEKDGARAVVELSPVGPPATAETETVGNYLLDLRPHRGTSGEIVLRFAADAPDFASRIELLGSDDLYAWRTLASAPLVRNRQFGDTIERNVIAVANPAPYVRIAWSGGTAPRLDGASWVESGTTPALPRARLALTRADKDGSWFVDVPPALPIARVFLRTPADNVAFRVRVFRYDDHPPQPRARLSLQARRAPERWIVEGSPRSVYRLNRAGEWIESPPFALSARTTQLRIDTVDTPPPSGGALPIVEVEWQPQRIVFAASEPAPYVLAVGSDSVDLKSPPPLDLRGVLAPDDPSATRLPVATLAATAIVVNGDARAQRIAREASWSRYVLWGGLAAAVCALAFMAWRLAAQLKLGRNDTPETGDRPGA
jgi:hypothetical protein